MLKSIILYSSIMLVVSAASGESKQSRAPVQGSVVSQAQKLLGDRRAAFYKPDMRVSEAFGEFLQVGTSSAVNGPWTFVSGCRPHSCDEKAVAVVDSNGRLDGIALTSFDCRPRVLSSEELSARRTAALDKRPGPVCERQPITLIFIVRRSASIDQLASEADLLARLKAWGAEAGTKGEHVTVIDSSSAPTK